MRFAAAGASTSAHSHARIGARPRGQGSRGRRPAGNTRARGTRPSRRQRRQDVRRRRAAAPARAGPGTPPLSIGPAYQRNGRRRSGRPRPPAGAGRRCDRVGDDGHGRRDEPSPGSEASTFIAARPHSRIKRRAPSASATPHAQRSRAGTHSRPLGDHLQYVKARACSARGARGTG